MNKPIIILLALLFSVSCKAEPWTKEQKQLAGIATTLHIIDWSQTRYIAKHPHKYSELNPFLSDHPSLKQVNQHFLLTGLTTSLLAHYIPKHRTTILKTFVVIQTINTSRNFLLGIKMEF